MAKMSKHERALRDSLQSVTFDIVTAAREFNRATAKLNELRDREGFLKNILDEATLRRCSVPPDLDDESRRLQDEVLDGGAG